jgi:hypothetical protein
MRNSKIVLAIVGLVAIFYFIPVVGILLTVIFLNWKFRAVWRLRMALLIFFAVLLTGLYFSHSLNSFLSWFMR